MPRSLLSAIVCLLLGFCVSGSAVASTNGVTPIELAQAIEARASKSSFADLEAFGERARLMSGRERLNRLHHVAWTLLNQSEFRRFKTWNDRLAAQARADGDPRYVTMARLNDLQSRIDQGDGKVASRIQAIADAETDWFSRSHAMRLVAVQRLDDDKVGPALALLGEAEAIVPSREPYAATALAGIWEIRGLVLRDLQDLNGSANAFWRAEFIYTNSDYPRPDFDPLYSLGLVAVRLGEHALAEKFYAAHHRLSVRADLPGLTLWDVDICAVVAEARNAPREVLACISRLGEEVESFGHMVDHTLPMRALAFARLGRVDEAQRDLKTLQDLEARTIISPSSSDKLTRIRAEILRAQGRDAEAYEVFREHYATRVTSLARAHSAGLTQFTADLEQQLDQRRKQAETAAANAELQRRVIQAQRVTLVVGLLFLAGVLAVVVWQFRVGVQLKAARSRAEASNTAKSEFLANMSHEIRTPLNGVVGMAELLAGSNLSPRDKEIAEVIRSSGRTLEKLLSDIIDLARIEAGKIGLEHEPFILAEVIHSVAALSRLKAEEKGLTFQVFISDEADRRYRGDALRVRQILTNLLSNAVKFTDVGSVSIKAVRTADGALSIAVADTGIGLSESQRAEVFARFQQGDGSITRRFGGSGLGLAISRHLAELMGGKLDFTSAVAKGSEFRLELRLEEVEHDEEPDLASSTAVEPRGGLRVLVADDHPTNRKVVELILAEAGIEVCSVEDGAQAVEAFAANAFDLVLMDMQMPVMDGLTAVRAIRQGEAQRATGRVPILMLSANALPEHVLAGSAAGADGHVAKPISPIGLFEAMGAVLGP